MTMLVCTLHASVLVIPSIIVNNLLILKEGLIDDASCLCATPLPLKDIGLISVAASFPDRDIGEGHDEPVLSHLSHPVYIEIIETGSDSSCNDQVNTEHHDQDV